MPVETEQCGKQFPGNAVSAARIADTDRVSACELSILIPSPQPSP